MRSTITDITTLTDTALVDDLATTHTRLTAHKARFILALTEFHDRNLARTQGAPTTTTWLMRRLNISYRTSAEYLATGRIMKNFPAVADHFLRGEFSYSIVRLLGRYLTDDTADELIDLARRLAYHELEQALSGRPRPGKQTTKKTNVLSIIRDPDTGGLSFWGRLDATHGAEFLAAVKIGELAHLRAITPDDLHDLLHRDGDPGQVTIDLDHPAPAEQDEPEAPGDGARPTDHDGEPRSTGSDPGDDTARGGATLREDEQRDPDPDQEGDDRRHPVTRFGPPTADTAFTGLLGMINLVRTTPRSTVRAPGAELNILLGPDGRLVLPGHIGTQASHLLRTILNGTARIHLLDRDGIHLTLSRSARTVSPGLEKALLARWNHQCATPACPHTRFLQFHHITAWADGGGTDPDNLIPLCSACHAMIAAGTLTIHLDAINPSLLRFRFPGGHSHTSDRRGLPEHNTALGPHRDTYTHGPVPHGDESLIITHPDDTFDDVA